MADISNTTSNTVITGTSDSDSITNYGNTAVSIDAGAGNDSIHNFFSDNITINGGTGDDYVNNNIDWEISRGTVYIYSGGNDTLEMFGADDSFLIIEGYSWATIANEDTGDLLVNVLDGAETIGSISLPRHHGFWPGRLKIVSSKEEFDALNLIINAEDNQTLTGTDAKNVITNTADNVIINGGADNDSIANLADRVDRTTNVLIDAGDGNNQIYNDACNITISAGAGDDSVWNNNYNNAGVVYVYGGGNDTLDNFGANTFVVLGNVEVKSTGALENVGTVLRLSNGKTLTFTGDYRASLVSSPDKIPAMNITYNAESDIVVTGKQEAGTIDFIYNDNDGNKVTINGNDNADIIYNFFNENVLIDGGAGKDSIANAGSNMTIDGGAGSDYIRNQDGVNVLIDAGEGDDEIISNGTDVTITGGKGNDSIRNNGTSVTIDAGEGDDSISNGYSSVQIDSGAGNDSIINDGAAVSITGGNGNDSIRDWGTNVTISGDAGDDYFDIHNSTNALIIYNANDGFDKIDNFNETATLQIGDGSGTYSAAKSGDDIILTVGNGKITLSGAATLSSVNISGMGVEDFDAATSIDGGRGNDTLDDTEGDNTLTGGKGNDVFVYNGGNDVITDYSQNGTGGADKISIASGLTYENYELDGNNLILNYADENSLTILDGKGKAITFAGKKSTVRIYEDAGVFDSKKKSVTLAADIKDSFSAGKYSKLITIDGSQVDSEIAITGNKKANLIIAGETNTTLNGGKGKDTLTGGAGEDIFIYDNKSGNKVIRNYNFEDDDLISLGNGAIISQVTTKNKNVVLKVGSNTVTIEDADKFIFAQDGTTKTYDDGKLVVGDSVTLASDFKGAFSLADNDAYNHVSAELTKKAVTLIGDAADNSLIGGKGNDSLWGGGGADTFIYQAGKGNDVIGDYNFEDGDLLQIIDKRGRMISKDAVKKWTFDGDDLTLSIKGGGKVILAGVGAKTSINVNGSVQFF